MVLVVVGARCEGGSSSVRSATQQTVWLSRVVIVAEQGTVPAFGSHRLGAQSTRPALFSRLPTSKSTGYRPTRSSSSFVGRLLFSPSISITITRTDSGQSVLPSSFLIKRKRVYWSKVCWKRWSFDSIKCLVKQLRQGLSWRCHWLDKDGRPTLPFGWTVWYVKLFDGDVLFKRSILFGLKLDTSSQPNRHH